jgi:hypothetical protein
MVNAELNQLKAIKNNLNNLQKFFSQFEIYQFFGLEPEKIECKLYGSIE